MPLTIRPCLKTDLDELQRISHTTFDETFGPMNSRKTMVQYLETAFNKDKLLAELNHAHSHFYFLYLKDDLAGYLKINQAPAQTDINDPSSIELERIYIIKAFKGRGLGSQLMAYALELAQDMKKDYVWLGVWEKNLGAISFYKKMGFIEESRHPFKIGDELQNDLIMKKQLNPDLAQRLEDSHFPATKKLKKPY